MPDQQTAPDRDQMIAQLDRWQHSGVIEYVAPPPAGSAQWVIGVGGQAVTMDSDAAVATFLAGISATAGWAHGQAPRIGDSPPVNSQCPRCSGTGSRWCSCTAPCGWVACGWQSRDGQVTADGLAADIRRAWAAEFPGTGRSGLDYQMAYSAARTALARLAHGKE